MRFIENKRLKALIEVIKEFRKYYEEVVKKDSMPEVYDFTISAEGFEPERKGELENNINFLAKLVDTAWRGKNVETEDLKKFHQMLGVIGDKLLRKIFTIAVQQYRLCGKFILTENGFTNTTKVLVHFLYAVRREIFSLIIIHIVSKVERCDEYDEDNDLVIDILEDGFVAEEAIFTFQDNLASSVERYRFLVHIDFPFNPRRDKEPKEC